MTYRDYICLALYLFIQAWILVFNGRHVSDTFVFKYLPQEVAYLSESYIKSMHMSPQLQ